jgi:hypothetical protein
LGLLTSLKIKIKNRRVKKMILSKMKKIAPVALGLLATSAYASTSATAYLQAPASSATSSNEVSINGTVRVAGTNTGGYNMNAQAVQNLFGPNLVRASFTVSPKGSISRVKDVPASTYYAQARPSYINHKDGYGWTSGTATILNG